MNEEIDEDRKKILRETKRERARRSE